MANAMCRILVWLVRTVVQWLSDKCKHEENHPDCESRVSNGLNELECVITDAAALAARVLQWFELGEAQIGAGKSVMESIARCTAVNILPWVTVPGTNSPSLRIV